MLYNPDIYVKNWNRLQNAADLGWVFFIDVKIAHVCYIYFHYVLKLHKM